MRFQKQLFEHKPELGTWGDCARTVLACLLDVDVEEVPHHHRDLADGEQNDLFREWLKPRGLTLAFFAFGKTEESGALELAKLVMATSNPGVVYMLSGTSQRGFNHVVIARDREIIWDPHDGDEFGLVGPCTDGYAYVELLVRRAD